MEQIFGGGILWTLLIGFLAGLLARALKPGNDKLGFFMTIVLGILGALLARFIGVRSAGTRTASRPASSPP